MLALDLKNLSRHHDRFVAAHQAAVKEEAETARDKLLEYARSRPRFTPRTGKTQKANRARVIRTKGKVIVRASNRLKHAAALDRGARPHIIRARNAPYLHFKGKYGWVRTKSVRHPGNKPYRFLYGATVAAGRSFHQSMSARMRRLASKF